jgi:hypothetical protein
MNKNYEVEINKIEGYQSCLDENDICIRISWNANIGFGQLEMIVNKITGKVILDTECLNENFAKQIFAKLVDEAEII